VQARATVIEGSNPNPGVVVAAADEGLSQAAVEGTSNDREQDAGEAEMATDEEEDAASGAGSQEAEGDLVSSGEEMASSETDMGGLEDRQEEGAADDEAQYGETDDS